MKSTRAKESQFFGLNSMHSAHSLDAAGCDGAVASVEPSQSEDQRVCPVLREQCRP